MTYKPPKHPPGDRSHLERLIQALSIEEGIATDRLRRWVSTQVLLGALARGNDDEQRFLLKGGVAMELRLRLRARATKDIDVIVIPDGEVDLIDALRIALEEPLSGLRFSAGADSEHRVHADAADGREDDLQGQAVGSAAA